MTADFARDSGTLLEAELVRQQVRAALFGVPVEGVSLGRFVVTRRVGRGGLGNVYEAWDRERHQEVALKALHDVQPDSSYRLKREFRTLAEVDHPCLARSCAARMALRSFRTQRGS